MGGPQVLIALMNSMVRRSLISMLSVFRRVRAHHGALTKVAQQPAKCLEYLQFWADRRRWFCEMIIPTWRDSVRSTSVWRSLGIRENLQDVAAPLAEVGLDDICPATQTNDRAGLFLN